MIELAQYQIEGAAGTAELVDAVERAVERGALAAGTRLPSVRAMAAQLGLSPTTVAAALGELRRRGILVTRPRSGTFVGSRPPVAISWGLELPPGLRDLATGNPDPRLLPDAARALRALDPPQTLYGQRATSEALLELARPELATAGVACDHLTVVGGALDGVERALRAHLRPGDRVAVEDPGYPGVLDLCRAMGLVMAPVAIDERGMLPEALEPALAQGVAAVVIVPRGQNPTGASLDRTRQRELSRVLAEWPDVLLVEDDHLGPVGGEPRRTLTKRRQRWAAALSTSKALGPDLRVAILAGDETTVARVAGRYMLGPQWVSHLLQELAARLWTQAAAAGQLERAASAYARRRERLLADLAAHGIAATGRAGLNVWVPVADEAAVVQRLAERGWGVAPGAAFRLDATPAIRITTASLRREESRRLAADVAVALRPPALTRAA